MKLSIISLGSILALTTFVAPVTAKSWWCNGNWDDGDLHRVSFKFNGYCEGQWGQCFLYSLRAAGLNPHNWQAWKTDDGNWQVDFSIPKGKSDLANKGIEDITHVWKGCWPGQ
ncbi:uncharacterized protein EHS24_004706 [Apiotrichum porosum]|uniref:Uncharacterized protein n=1 Tax=Apiotrichum porosum TaxID=105984 RepID=A0A427Y5V0_9TREE|nr:uncharacterized protein EHS24_004706 [Apiotrichum porosum]RSH86450.1 hypothetical protein EHS24_004706 [Apiotrichum porosum]